MDNPLNLYTGTSGLVLPITKANFPEAFSDKGRLAYYSSLLNSIEINSSFYKLPMASTVKRWASEVPSGFRFTFKFWEEITHTKHLAFRREDVERFLQVIEHAGDNRGCLLLQFPASTKIDNLNNLNSLLSIIRECDPSAQWTIAVEFRDKSWYQQNVYDLLDQYGATMVLHDFRNVTAPMEKNKADTVYVRFHGPEGGYRGSYAEGFLCEYARYINDWREEGKTVYVYFNNTAGDAFQNLITLNSFLYQS